MRVESPAAAGLYSLAVKLATVVIFAVRGFQYAWPPLAYSIDRRRRRPRALYARVTTYYVLVTGLVVAGFALLGRWVVRLLAAPDVLRRPRGAAVGRARLGAVRALPVLVAIAGRAKVTIRNAARRRSPAWSVNVALLARARPAARDRGRRRSRCAAPTS